MNLLLSGSVYTLNAENANLSKLKEKSDHFRSVTGKLESYNIELKILSEREV